MASSSRRRRRRRHGKFVVKFAVVRGRTVARWTNSEDPSAKQPDVGKDLSNGDPIDMREEEDVDAAAAAAAPLQGQADPGGEGEEEEEDLDMVDEVPAALLCEDDDWERETVGLGDDDEPAAVHSADMEAEEDETDGEEEAEDVTVVPVLASSSRHRARIERGVGKDLSNGDPVDMGEEHEDDPDMADPTAPLEAGEEEGEDIDMDELPAGEEESDEEVVQEAKDSAGKEAPIEKPFQCRICKKGFKRRYHMDRHVREVHEGQKRNRVAKETPEGEEKEEEEEEESDDEAPFECDICGKSFASRKNVGRHLAEHHGGKKRGEKKPCPHSGKECANVSRHIKLVHDEKKEFPCDWCEMRFPFKENLDRHLEGRIKVDCNFCGKKFCHKTSLARHLSTDHPDEYVNKKKICPICGKEYVNLTNHVKLVHEGRKDGLCDQCGKRFCFQAGLSRHVRAVHRVVKEAACRFCGRKFSTKSSMTRHVSTQHPDMLLWASFCERTLSVDEVPATLLREDDDDDDGERENVLGDDDEPAAVKPADMDRQVARGIVRPEDQLGPVPTNHPDEKVERIILMKALLAQARHMSTQHPDGALV